MGKVSLAYKRIGVILIACAIFGFLTVADDLRHTGELIGILSLLLSGIILFFVPSTKVILKNFSQEWVAFGILFGFSIGGVVLDNMFIGIVFGIVIGIFIAFAVGRQK
jgi:hypothetical protein